MNQVTDQHFKSLQTSLNVFSVMIRLKETLLVVHLEKLITCLFVTFLQCSYNYCSFLAQYISLEWFTIQSLYLNCRKIVFKLSTNSFNTQTKSYTPFANCFINYALLIKFIPRLQNAYTQIFHIPDLNPVEYIRYMEERVHRTMIRDVEVLRGRILKVCEELYRCVNDKALSEWLKWLVTFFKLKQIFIQLFILLVEWTYNELPF